MASVTNAKCPREEIFEGRMTVPKSSSIEGKHEEEEEEEVKDGEGEENEEVEKMGDGEEEEEEENGEVEEMEEVEKEESTEVEEVEDEEDDEEEMFNLCEEIMPLYEDVKTTERQLDNGWETDGTSCFRGRYICRQDGRCIVCIDDDIIENKDMIRQLLNYYQDICNSEGFHIENEPPPEYYNYIKVLKYESEDETIKANIKHNVQLAIDKYNEKFVGQRSLDLQEIVSVNVAEDMRFVFYITLWAKEFPSGETNLYQTRLRVCQLDYDYRPPACLVKVHVFRPFRSPKPGSAIEWAFIGSCRALRQYPVKGKYFRGTAEQALAFLESLDMEHVQGCKQ